MLLLYDHLAAPLAESVAQLEGKDGNAGMLKLALEELGSDVDFLNKAGHTCGQFIFELGKANPLGITKHLDLVTLHLERDVSGRSKLKFQTGTNPYVFQPYTMRQGVIELLGYLILHVYMNPDLTKEQEEEKRMIFTYLLAHLLDVTSFCRAKVSQQ